ncbi:hypothetical protein K501DRAFT_277275 [Backusella circina FSU 941]|nr:hypothetical protein K501DRAFT_277275 [Backusella circina FSU 941]
MSIQSGQSGQSGQFNPHIFHWKNEYNFEGGKTVISYEANGFHRHYRKHNCEDTNDVQASIHENSEDAKNLTNTSEISLSQVKNAEIPGNPLDTFSFSSDTSEKIKLLTNSFYDGFDICFKKMKEENKWKLRSERVVEDILYSYEADLEREKFLLINVFYLSSAVHSFIIDISDSQVKNLFTDDEWAEITIESNKKDAALSEEKMGWRYVSYFKKSWI